MSKERPSVESIQYEYGTVYTVVLFTVRGNRYIR